MPNEENDNKPAADQVVCDCKEVFNRLSEGDRLKLQAAATFKALTAFVREETKYHPARYPFYAAYLLAAVTSLFIPFTTVPLVACSLVWARYSKSESAARLKARLKDDFNNKAALVCHHKDYIIPEDQRDPEQSAIKTLALAWHTTKSAASDVGKTTAYAFKALKNLTIP